MNNDNSNSNMNMNMLTMALGRMFDSRDGQMTDNHIGKIHLTISQLSVFATSGLFYKHITIKNNDPRAICK